MSATHCVFCGFVVLALFVACGGGDDFSSPSSGGAGASAGGANVAGSTSARGAAPSVAGAAGDAGAPSELGGGASVGGSETGKAGASVGGTGAALAGAGGALESAGNAGVRNENAGAGGGAGGGAPVCTPFDVGKPALPKRCQQVVNNGCDVGDTCFTLEQPYPSIQSAQYDRCMPTQLETTCAACRETMTCACLAADFHFDKTGLDKWHCCDTAAGPVYVLYYQCPPK